ncbi:hypothetical protein HD597_000740 [Nonomuraea thailandensis]|uniref:Uncharacterized protein n=1 Tax=Nonomuraea thailandensis TaxID=1188745 RepID=A0A9X2G9T8_9ACTN|nr:DUF6461 domain-containing protein [Nonomuraea thailandensis]MCP2353720.1 hypothetical protein [Nonomuraea thailandensis]
MRLATSHDYAWQDVWEGVYTLTFVRDLGERETLRRFGVADANIRRYTWDERDEYHEEVGEFSELVVVTRVRGWTLAYEALGWEGKRPEVLRELSLGGEAVAVMRNDYTASHHFGHAVDGEWRTAFHTRQPGKRWGARPDALNGHLRELGLEPEPAGLASPSVRPSVAPVLALASRVTGVLFERTMVEGAPLLGGIITGRVPYE